MFACKKYVLFMILSFADAVWDFEELGLKMRIKS